MAKTSVAVKNMWKSTREGKIKAIFDVHMADGLVLKEFRLVEGKNGFFVAPPYREYKDKGGERRFKNLVEMPETLNEQLLDMAKEQYGSDDEVDEEWT